MSHRFRVLSLLTWGGLWAAEVPKAFVNSPLAFEPNRGQFAERKNFGTRAAGFSAMFSDVDVTYVLRAGDQRGVLKAQWVGRRSAATLAPVEQLPGRSNYYVGGAAVTDVPTYKQLRAVGIYKGIDVLYYGNSQTLEYDLVIAPGADLSRVAMAFTGGSPRVDAGGDLVIEAAGGRFVQHRPVAYQEVAGRRVEVEAGYVVEDGVVRFALGEYDHSRTLVIDPTVAWSTTLGALSGVSNIGDANGVAVDAAGNIFVAGTTNSADFPTFNAFRGDIGSTRNSDAFLTKFSPDGVILFSTYFGGSDYDTGAALALDSSGNVVIVGRTESDDLPTKNPLQSSRGSSDMYVARFGTTGGLLYSSYVGGGGRGDMRGVAVDAANNIYFTAESGPGFSTTPGALQTTSNAFMDTVVAKLSADGSTLIFATYLGGNFDWPHGIALGPDNSVYLAGYVQTGYFPLKNAFSSDCSYTPGAAYAARLAADGGSLIYCTCLGPGEAFSVAVDSSGASYMTGAAYYGFPVKNAIQPNFVGTLYDSDIPDVFLLKLTADGSTLVYSTFLGGSGSDRGNAIRIDASGSATVAGSTTSPDFPTVAAFNPALANTQGFVTQVTPAGDAIKFSSFITGGYSWVPWALALDGSGNIYVAGTAVTSASSFTSAAPFVAKLSGPIVSIPVTFATDPAGLVVPVDGALITTPKTFLWAPNVSHKIGIPSTQAGANGLGEQFAFWSNGSTKAQTILSPATATTYTATFVPCTYTLSPASTVIGQAGGKVTIAINTQAGCPWTALGGTLWALPDGGVSGPGTGSVSLKVLPNTTGASRTMAISVGSLLARVTQTSSKPTASYISTGAGGAYNVFQLNINHPDGTGNLAVSNLLIGAYLDGRSACYLAFDHTANVLYLVQDDGSKLVGLQFDASGHATSDISNSQCKVTGSQSLIVPTASATQAVLDIAITFAPSFAGNKVLYLAAGDKTGANTGWMPVGVWSVPGVVRYPAVVGAAVNTSSVSVTYGDATDNANLTPSQILVNSALDGRSACYMGYDHVHNLLYLVNDAGNALLPGITPGVGSGTQQNSQCRISAVGSSVATSGSSYTLTVNVSYLTGFRGQMIVYAATQTAAGGNTGWQAVGSLTLP